MTHLPLQSKNDSEHSEVTTLADSLRDSSVNSALIAIAQEVAELLKQAHPAQDSAQADEIDDRELAKQKDFSQSLPHLK
ncbi:hypothetical protein [Leptolyngbya sp. FACHB-261]|uniref:hypothetical protein n=1 Tax=Leptolyngbya sp. FACHB-261 TaxID=2692806 RepID=UPI001689A7B6|nr:hypothetical protein [Leptolyngbya sp. FACHB-261]MBD2100005.1 hypothetical protein [Leptolyngbya sp. FACHB-261]